MLKLATLAGAALATLCFAQPAAASQTGCMAASEVNEKDVRRHREALADACIQLKTLKEDGRNWRIFTITKNEPGPLWAVLHDNENAAFSASVDALNRFGGTILAVEAGERRMFKGKDPNRNFGTKCGDARKFTDFVMGYADMAGTVIALHSNARGFKGDGRGGKGHISVYRKSRVLQGRPTRRAKGAFKSGDNFVLVPARSENGAKRRIAKLHRQGAHAMWERVTKKGNDCSMSNHAVLTGFADYMNVEVAHGEAQTAKALVRKAMKAR